MKLPHLICFEDRCASNFTSQATATSEQKLIKNNVTSLGVINDKVMIVLFQVMTVVQIFPAENGIT